jgi:hypothetical protein
MVLGGINMNMPEPGTMGYELMIDHMRADLESGMALTKIEMAARKILKEAGKDFDTEFAKWKENLHG